MKLKMFIPISKIDVEQRLVYGLATAEKRDGAKEICDYESTKPFYEKWSGNIAKVTEGKSHGNLRSMHANIAAGKLLPIVFNDEAKQIEICGKVVDDGEWNKVLEGVYTGFSQGGRYVKRWKDPTDPELTRYTAEPIEVSLVDVPCLPGCEFVAIKADGATEMRKFKTVIAEPTAAEVATKAVELAVGAGGQWIDFIGDAREDLMKAANVKAVAEMPAPVDGEETPEPVAKGGKPEEGDVGAVQVWTHPDLPGEQFTKKADLRTALVKKAAETEAATVSSGVTDKLAEIGAELDKHAPPAFDIVKLGDEAYRKAAGISADDWMVFNAFVKANKDHALVKAIAGWKPVEIEKTTGVVTFPTETVEAIKGLVVAARSAPVAKTGTEVGKPMIKIAHFAPVAGLSKGAVAELFSKGLYDIGRLASLISELAWLQDALVYEALFEQDASLVPDQLKASIASLCGVLRMLVIEETQELVGDDMVIEVLEAGAGLVPHGHIDALVKFVAETPDLKKISELLDKVGARNSKADNERIGKMHTLAVELGATCGGDAGKSLANQLTTVTAERDALKVSMEKLGPKLDETLERIKKIEATPMPGGPARTDTSGLAIHKNRDGTAGGASMDKAGVEAALAAMSDEDRVTIMIKASQANGQVLGG